MWKNAVQLEETRLQNVRTIADYPAFHERHRIFPAVFENRNHHKILDLSAGVGCVAERVRNNYPAFLICNDISPTCRQILHQLNLETTSFDISQEDQSFPFFDGYFDAVITLATIEHIIHVDHFVQEIHRILSDTGYLYISAPNYAALLYLWRFLVRGKTFHDPLSPASRYEFYAHVRYFTYYTLREFISSFGFVLDTVYLALPQQSTRYRELYAGSKFKALSYRYVMMLIYTFGSPRWSAEPVLCFRKVSQPQQDSGKLRKVVL